MAPDDARPGGGSRGWWRDALRRRMLAIADILAALLASVSLAAASGIDAGFWAALLLPIWPVLAKLHGLYDRDHRSLRHLTVDEVPSVLLWSLTCTGATAALLLLTPVGTLHVSAALLAWVAASLAALVLRASARSLWRRLTPPDRTMILGHGPLAQAVRRKLELFPDTHTEVVTANGDTNGDLSLLLSHGVDRILLASEEIDEREIAYLLALCRERRIKLGVVPPARAMFGTAVHLEHIADLPIIEYNTWDVSRSTLFVKRILDVSVAVPALVLLAPLLAVLAVAVKLGSRGPALFVQQRAGLHGRPFPVFKFRTMKADAQKRLIDLVALADLPDPMFKLKGDPRVTRLGRILRRTSLDELPQLVNVVVGHMSLVGPRPEQVDLVECYAEEHRFRLAVKPGMTGPMQVYGRGELSFEERLAVEREYVENLSLGRDVRILLMTVPVTILGKGAY